MRRLWSEDTLTYDGKYHTVDRAGINPRPSRPIPIWFGGSSPVVLERTARLGDGWMPLGSPNDTSRDAIDDHQGAPGSGRVVDGRVRHPGPGAVRRGHPRAVAGSRREVGGPGRHPPRHRHPQRRADGCRRPPRSDRRVPGRGHRLTEPAGHGCARSTCSLNPVPTPSSHVARRGFVRPSQREHRCACPRGERLDQGFRCGGPERSDAR